MVSAAPSRAKNLPQFDLRARPLSMYDIRLEEFIAECERLIREDRREMDNRARDFMLFSPFLPGNPTDRRPVSISATNLIAVAKGASWAPSAYAATAASRLAGAASSALGRDVQTVGITALEGLDLAGVGLLILSVGAASDLSKNDFDTIAEYMQTGGFVYLDRDQDGHTYQGFISAMNRYVSSQSNPVIDIAPLSPDNPLRSVLTAAGALPGNTSNAVAPLSIRCNGKIAGIVADSSFMTRWSTASEESSALRSGFELLSYVFSHAPAPESAGNPEHR